MAYEQPTQQPGVEGDQPEDNNLNPLDRLEQSRRELEHSWGELIKAAGAINKSKWVIPVTQAAIEFMLATLGLGPLLGGLSIVIVLLLAVGGLLLWYNQPNNPIHLRRGSHRFPEPVNVANSTDRENLLRVQSAAGLVSALQQELQNARNVEFEIATALKELEKVSLKGEDKQALTDSLNELKKLAASARDAKQANDQARLDRLLTEFKQKVIEYNGLIVKTLYPGITSFLNVPWRFQPSGSTTCNYFAAMAAALYHLGQAGRYSAELERAITPGRSSQPEGCPATTKGYLEFAAKKAGGKSVEVAVLPFQGNQPPWDDIKKLVAQGKPVVIGTGYSKRRIPTHFLTITGFGSYQGKEVAYVVDPGAMLAKRTLAPEALRATRHYLDDSRWLGKYRNAYYYKTLVF